MVLKGKHILLGITGGIAAYKIPLLVRLLVKEGAEVQVIMTPSAHQFVTAQTLTTLSERPVLTHFFSEEDGTWNHHVALANKADIMVIAPLTANTLAKMATGQADNLLLATWMSFAKTTLVVPAMDLEMYAHNTTAANLQQLNPTQTVILPAQYGELASGLIGQGRMTEPEDILKAVCDILIPDTRWKGLEVLVTAGPTYEPIDPVRFIGNNASGKMGFAIADALLQLGANVTLISGPTHLKPTNNNNLRHINIITANDMWEAVKPHLETYDVAIMAAAVADYTPVKPAVKKLKKQDNALSIDLKPTRDILKTLGEYKKENQRLIGFALETDNELENAQNKRIKKNADMIVLNSLNDSNAGFGFDTNQVTLVTSAKIYPISLRSKSEIATQILNYFEKEGFLDSVHS